MTAPTLLILAGKRDGKLDPLAERAGVSHKCRVPIAGKPLLQWVLEGVQDAYPDSRILVSIHDAKVIADLPAVQQLSAAGRLEIIEARATIVDSVAAAIETLDRPYPLLITTGDNVLVTAELIREIHEGAKAHQAQAVLGVARRESVRAAHPEAQHNFYKFGDMAIANCNIYWLGDPAAFAAAEAFREGGQFMRSKKRIANAFGYLNLLRFALGRWTMATAMHSLSRRFGVKVRAHLIEDGAYAVDVDNERTYNISEMLLKQRKS